MIDMSISASWLILAVMVLRQILKKVPRWVCCVLWAMVAVRLICPVTIESAWSLVPGTTMTQPVVPTEVSALNSYNNVLEKRIWANGTALADTNIVFFIWLCGVFILFGYSIFSYFRMRRTVREAVPYRENIWLCDTIPSPFILGIIHPRIYLPSGLEEEELILLHEQAHLKRKDYWWKPLGHLLVTVYWFNPLVWIAYALFCKDIELACDEKVIADLSMEEKKTYARLLVSVSMHRKMVLSCPLAFGEVGIKARVKNILNHRKPTFWLMITAVAVCVLAAVCFLTSPKSDKEITVVIPAGSSSDEFFYAEEELCSYKNKVTVTKLEGGDAEVCLLSADEHQAEKEYITSGLPVTLNVEKNTWFKIGIRQGNETDKPAVVRLRVKQVDIRIE